MKPMTHREMITGLFVRAWVFDLRSDYPRAQWYMARAMAEYVIASAGPS